MRYVHRRIGEASLEERVENALKRGFCALVGFPGIGKTTTARYISAKLAGEGKNVVWIIPTSEGELGVNVGIRPLIFEDGVSGNIIEIRINQTYANVWKFYDCLWTIAHVAENLEKYRKEFEKFLKQFLRWLQKKKKNLAKSLLKGGKKVHVIALTGVHIGEFTEAMAEFLREEGFSELMEGAKDVGEAIAKALKEKPYGILANIRDKITDAAKSSKFLGQMAKRIVDVIESFGGAAEISIEEIARYGAVFVFGLLGVTGIIEFVNLIREEREEKKRKHVHRIVREKLEKVKDKVVFVVDDLEDARVREAMEAAFQEIIEVIMEAKCPLLAVRRFSTPLSNIQIELVDEILGIVGGAEKFSRTLRKQTVLNILGMGKLKIVPKICRDQIILMLTTSYEEFVRILKANLPEEKVEELGNELEELWKRFCMNPHLAISLVMHGVRVEDIKGVEPYYHKKLAEKLSREDIKQMIAWQITGFMYLYDRIRRDKPYIIPLSLHPVAEDEMQRFLEKFTDRPKYFMEELKNNAGESEILVGEEEFGDGKRRVYYLDEDAQKLGIYFTSLAEFKEKYLRSIAEIRLKLLRIMTENAKSTGWQTFRMILASLSDAEFLLEHIDKLKGEEIDSLEDEIKGMLLFWAGKGIMMNILKGKHFLIALESLESKNPALALVYLGILAERLKTIELGADELVEILEEILKKLSSLSPDREYELALKLCAVGSSLSALIWIKGKRELLERFDALMNEALKIKSETLRRITLIGLKTGKAEALLNFALGEEGLKKVESLCYEMKKLIGEIKGLDRETEKFLKVVYGGDPEEMLRRYLSSYKGVMYYILGRSQLNLGEENAIESFEKAFETAHRLKEYWNATSCLSRKYRAEICLRWSLGEEINLAELMEYFEKYRGLCSPATVSGTYAKLALAEALRGEDAREIVKRVLFPDDRALLLGVLAVLGMWEKEEAKEELMRADKKRSKEWKEELESLERKVTRSDRDKFLKKFAEYNNISLREAIEIYRAYLNKDKKLEDMLLSLRPVSSFHSTIRVLRLYLEGKEKEARETAEWSSEKYSPLPNKLFSQVADALRMGNEEKFKEAMVKFFFYHI